MKIEALLGQLDAVTRLTTFLDSDKSGEVYDLGELVQHVPGLNVRSSNLRPSKSPRLKEYSIVVTTTSTVKTFYGNPKTILRAKSLMEKK